MSSLLNCVPFLPAYQRGLPANVFSCEHTNVPKVPACYLIFTCQRPNERASVPNGVPTFQIGVSICQRTCQFFKHFSFEMLREISILYFWIKSSTLYLVSYLYHTRIKPALYLISVLHAILKKCLWIFCFMKLFCSLERPGFYTLQVPKDFWNYPLKQLKQNAEYVWILWPSWIDLLEFEIQDSYKETLLWLCFFPFLTIIFSSTVVPTLQKQPPEVFCHERCS